MRLGLPVICLALLSLVLLGGCSTGGDEESEQEVDFETSLHKTRKGKETWYRAGNGGFELLTGLPWGQGATLNCAGCHDTAAQPQWTEATCADCHGTDEPGEAAVEQATCLGCHKRQAGEIGLGLFDYHRDDEDFTCMDCHRDSDVHGDGTAYDSMWDVGGIQASCQTAGCHTTLASNRSHDLHAATVDCSACHMETAFSCLNCHFTQYADPAAKVADWIYLVNRNGKVHAGTLMTLAWTGDGEDETFAVIAPFYGHSVMEAEDARECDDCHLSEALLDLNADGELKLATWNAGVFENVKGVIPVPPAPTGTSVPDWLRSIFKVDFVEWDGAAWQYLEEGPDLFQMIDEYATPLTAAQFAKLNLWAQGLHTTRVGKETWYVATGQDAGDEPGFETLTGVPYDDLVCSECHDKAAFPDWEKPTCEDCHGGDDLDDLAGPPPVADSTCLGCHSRQGAEIGRWAFSDVHRDSALPTAPTTCMGCHSVGDVHGDGTDYVSMLDDGAIDANCEDCHVKDAAFLAANAYHTQHAEDEIHCDACHMQASLSCINCHFNDEVEGVGKWAHTQVANWRFLVNRDGMVHAATLMTLEYRDGQGEDQTFALFAPYYAHNIERDVINSCADCHDSANVQAIDAANAGNKVKLMAWTGGPKLTNPLTGIIPVPQSFKDKFAIDFVRIATRNADQSPATWSFLETGPDAWQMLRRYGAPLTSTQWTWLKATIPP